MIRMKTAVLLLISSVVIVTFGGESSGTRTSVMSPHLESTPFELVPIGSIERQGEKTVIRLDSRYRDGLLGLEEWSHIWVFYWFDRNDTPSQRSVLQVHPRGNPDNPLTGVFATRSPMRPNLVALNLCRVLAIEGTNIEIEESDALDRTPVLDIKPYSGGMDTPQGERRQPSWTRSGSVRE
jgi:tRNA-Thr(GGU) m(6)t(6)A37 methyltransferase TsaA